MTMLSEYEQALDRLIRNKPKRVALGTRISNDSVALEAGRSKGSIKKSRRVFYGLISAIQKAKQEQPEYQAPTSKLEQKIHKEEHYRLLYEQSLGRELLLLKRLHDMELELHNINTRSRLTIVK
ncbi:hypothetical protein JFU49_16600 [Pseudomonas sp. TH03]|uniref:hypothetical protein n=1 Tax=Pseudomonas sp. TH03 TaxID=2796369 RepID=UPI0019142DA5|nr:hypothetical protein [Pseudomonas sp. TH03]MBK5551881.1 hypothetical protein [Pseudomonas sp. TH03]